MSQRCVWTSKERQVTKYDVNYLSYIELCCTENRVNATIFGRLCGEKTTAHAYASMQCSDHLTPRSLFAALREYFITNCKTIVRHTSDFTEDVYTYAVRFCATKLQSITTLTGFIISAEINTLQWFHCVRFTPVIVRDFTDIIHLGNAMTTPHAIRHFVQMLTYGLRLSKATRAATVFAARRPNSRWMFEQAIQALLCSQHGDIDTSKFITHRRQAYFHEETADRLYVLLKRSEFFNHYTKPRYRLRN